jgi:hypothetical protein
VANLATNIARGPEHGIFEAVKAPLLCVASHFEMSAQAQTVWIRIGDESAVGRAFHPHPLIRRPTTNAR